MNDSSSSRFKLTAALLAIYIAWGSTYLSIRIAIQTIPPFLMAGARFMLAGVFLFGFLKWKGFPMPTLKQWRNSLAVGSFLLLGGNGLVGWAEQTVESGLAALLVSVAPLWMVFFERIGPAKKKIQPLVAIGLLMGFLGVALLMGPQVWNGDVHKSAGLGALMLAPILWAYGSVWSKRLELPPSPFMSTASQMMLGGMVLFGVGIVRGELGFFSWPRISVPSGVAFFYLVFFGAIVGFTAFVWLIKNAPISIAGTYAYVNPVVAVLIGWALAGERFSGLTLLAGGVILVSVILITLGEYQHRQKKRGFIS